MRKIIFAFSIVLSTVIVFSGCRKNDRDLDKETNSSRDNAAGENVFAGVLKMIGQYADSSAYLRAACATFTVDSVGTASWPKTLTIDFGSSNCIGIDGVQRKGKIIAVFSGRYRDTLTTVNVSLVGYYHEGNPVTVGSWSMTNNGHNSSGNLTYSVSVSNLRVTTSEGTVIWNASRTREWIAGESTTTDPSDDQYSIVGYGSGTGVNGNNFNVYVYNPLIVSMNCQYITKGAVTISPINLSTRYLDFGSGACDNTATVTINGVTYQITI